MSVSKPVALVLGTAKPVMEHLLATAKPVVDRLFPKALARRLARTPPVAATGEAARLVAGEVRDLEPATIAGYLWLALAALLTTLAACTSLWWAPRGWPTPKGLALTAHRRVPRPHWPPIGQAADGRHVSGRHLPGRAGPLGSRTIGIDLEALRAAAPPARPVFAARNDPAPGADQARGLTSGTESLRQPLPEVRGRPGSPWRAWSPSREAYGPGGRGAGGGRARPT